MREDWRVIREAPRYSISNKGKVRNNSTGRILKLGINSDGYPMVVLSLGERKTITRKIHVLVATMFVDGYSPGFEVNHIDGDKSNNRVRNLEWVSRSGNQRHAFVNNLHPTKRGGRIRIRETGQIFETQRDIADAIDGDQSAVQKVLNGERRQHKGYTFEYVD